MSLLLDTKAEVISGPREAELTFQGSLSGLAVTGPLLVFDVGGGSTELIVGESLSGSSAASIGHAVSLDVGAVRLTERIGLTDPPTPEQLVAVADATHQALRAAPDGDGRRLVGVAGTVTTMAAYIAGLAPYDSAKIHGCELTLQQLDKAVAELAAMTLEQRRNVPTIHPKRADIIVAGAVVVRTIVQHYRASSLLVSDRGVRWGLAHELAGVVA